MHTPTLPEIRKVHRLIQECRDLGDDCAVWNDHLIRGMQLLVDGDVVAAGQIAGVRSGKFASLGLLDVGWERGFDRSGWNNGLALWMSNPYYSPVMCAGYRHVVEGIGPAVISPQEVLPENDWHRTEAYQAVIDAMGCVHHLGCVFGIPTGPDDTQIWVFNRGKGKRAFNEREQAIVEYLSEAITPLIGGTLAGFREVRPSQLAPRVRQVLACALEGDGDKQIALRLRISDHTVNQYMKLIYRHFHVNSRAELLSRWIKRGWGATVAWNTGELPYVHLDVADRCA
jgi:DNA-binding CsgD family transcriptional regulator